jgi:hypothetical protein
MEFEIGPDHYTRNWNLLKEVAREWGEISKKYEFWKKVPFDRIERYVDEILAPDSPWEKIRALRKDIQEDFLLAGSLMFCFQHWLNDRKRQGYSYQEVSPYVLERLFWSVCRNAERWFEERREGDVHWLRIHTKRRLRSELLRAIEDLLSDDLPSDPLAAICASATEAEASVVRAWYEGYETATEEEEELARRHGLAGRDELYAILRRLAGGDSNSPPTTDRS